MWAAAAAAGEAAVATEEAAARDAVAVVRVEATGAQRPDTSNDRYLCRCQCLCRQR